MTRKNMAVTHMHTIIILYIHVECVDITLCTYSVGLGQLINYLVD